MKVDVPKRRASFENVIEGTRYRIPGKRSIATICFLPLGQTAWGYAEVKTVTEILDNEKELTLLLAVWLTLWTIGGLAALYSWLAQILGEEIVTLTPSALAIKRAVFGFEPTREFDLTKVRNLRVSREPSESGARKKSTSVFAGGTIAFDYGAKTFRFGSGVDHAEAAMIVSELTSRYRILATA